MPDLLQSLQGRDLGHLRIVAELWDIELEAADARSALRRLVPSLLDRQAVEEVVGDLTPEARAALDDLLQNRGELPWSLFTRRHGPVREMGPARRDRERPHLNPASAAEALWYRALVGRAFQDTPGGPQEFAFIPQDLLALVPASPGSGEAPLGRPASPAERAEAIPASDAILDHACTLLAALRAGLPVPESFPLVFTKNHRPAPADTGAAAKEDPGAGWQAIASSIPSEVLTELLRAAGLLDGENLPRPEPARAFLEAGRGQALAELARAWMGSADIDELRLLPGLSAEGEWQNDPLRARRAVLDFLSSVPAGPWWSLAAFIEAVRQRHPDFQRPAGDYDSWYLRQTSSGEFLRGFEHWDEVDGALLRYLICGPLHWLGILDLAAPEAGQAPSAFRFTAWAGALLKGEAPQGLPDEKEALHAGSDARLRIPRRAPRAVRYQVARFCAWEGEREDAYLYRLTPGSLERARGQGLRAGHLLALLNRHAAAVPPSLAKAVERWEARGAEAVVEPALVLRLRSPELLQAVRASRAARFLGEPLGPAAVIVKPGAWEKVLSILAELGYLGEFRESS